MLLASLTPVSQSLLYYIPFNCGSPTSILKCFLSKNLVSIPNDQIPNNTQILVLAKNKFNQTTSSDFVNCTSLIYLNMNYNFFTSFPYLPALANSLQVLLLTGNRITHIDPNNLAILSNLQALEIGYNLLTSITDMKFPNFQSIVLIGNLFTELPSLPLLGKSLQYIDLSNNMIRNFNSQVINYYSNLAYIALESNLLTTFPNYCTMPTNLSISFKILLRNNSFHCDCRLLWLRSNPSLFGGNNLVCSGPANLAGLPLNNVSASQLICGGKSWCYSVNM